jgi:hypothetical protein
MRLVRCHCNGGDANLTDAAGQVRGMACLIPPVGRFETLALPNL